MEQIGSQSGLAGQVVSICRSDRWYVHHRLQELDIPCSCPEDGSLRVEINGAIAALQLRSVIQQLTASRQQLIAGLEQCWFLS